MFGARGILEQTKIDERGVLTIDSLGEAVEQGNMTARWIEAGELEVGDLDETQANELYVYLMFKNSICDMSLLRALSPGTPDSELRSLKKGGKKKDVRYNDVFTIFQFYKESQANQVQRGRRDRKERRDVSDHKATQVREFACPLITPPSPSR